MKTLKTKDKEMPENIHSGHRQRMRTKLMNNTSGQLLEHELLEILLYYCQPRKNTNELAHLLLNEFGNLKNILNANPQELLKIKGVSDSTIAFLKLFPELFETYHKVQNLPMMNVKTTVQLKHFIFPAIKNACNEVLYIIYADEKHDAFAYEQLKRGNAVRIDTAMDEILRAVQRKSPKYVSLAHNHPYGNSAPSTEDVVSTIKIKYMLKFLGVELYDHIVFGGGGYCSMKTMVDREFDLLMKHIAGQKENISRKMEFVVYNVDE